MKTKCNFCGKVLTSQRGLNRHLQMCKPIKKQKTFTEASRVPSVVDIKVANPTIDRTAYDDDSSISGASDCPLEEYDWNDDDVGESCEYKINTSMFGKDVFLTPSECIEMKLLNFCEKINAPLYAYDELMTILSSCRVNENTFSTQFTRRKALVQKLKKQYEMEDCEPQQRHVQLENGHQVTVMTCPFLPMLHSLLNDPRCVKDENFTFQNDNPYSYPDETGIRDELHSGSWYRDTWKERCQEEGDSILALYLFIDKTFTDVYGRLNFEPVQFSLSIFNRSTRNQYHAWRPLGYITDLKCGENKMQITSIGRDSTNDPQMRSRSERNMRDYHKILGIVLKDFRNVQKGGKIRYDLTYKGQIYKMKFIPILGPIIGDTSGHDMLVGRYSGRTNVTRICRYCDCHFLNSDNPDVLFEYTKQDDIRKLFVESNKESKIQLNRISYHYVDNALHALDCGSSDRGIHGLCPVELLHCMRLGLLKIAAECFAELLTQTHLDNFDKLLSSMSSQFRHQSCRNMPKTTFSGSIMNLKRKTADEWTGIILLIDASLQTKCGKHIWNSAKLQDSVKNGYIKIFEKCLILEKWLQKEDGYKLATFEDAKRTIIKFMKDYKSTCSRQIGNNMKLVKFHMLLHIIDDIERLGCPQNTNGGPCESNFKPQKKESVRTQRRANLFHEQMANRIYEQLVISRANYEETVQYQTTIPNKLVCGSKFRIHYDVDNMEYEIQWRTPVYKRQIYDETIIEFVYNIFFNSENEYDINCFTEHRINGEIFHGDCSYRGEQEWYDWANILWDNDSDDNNTTTILAKIHMFIDCTNHEFTPPKIVNGLEICGNDIYAIISSLTWKEPTLMGVSKLFYKGSLDQNNGTISYYVVPVTAINGTAVAVYDIEQENYSKMETNIMIMTPIEEWETKYDDMFPLTE